MVAERAFREYLGGHSWPVGLEDGLLHSLTSHKPALRIFVSDNSSSMNKRDARRILHPHASHHHIHTHNNGTPESGHPRTHSLASSSLSEHVNNHAIHTREGRASSAESAATIQSAKSDPDPDPEPQYVKCTRWAELSATIAFHAQLAKLSAAVTSAHSAATDSVQRSSVNSEFRFLHHHTNAMNTSMIDALSPSHLHSSHHSHPHRHSHSALPCFIIGDVERDGDSGDDFEALEHFLKESVFPTGHVSSRKDALIREIVEIGQRAYHLSPVEGESERENKIVHVLLATDYNGEREEGESEMEGIEDTDLAAIIAKAWSSIPGVSVHLTVRLSCTDSHTLRYWHGVRHRLLTHTSSPTSSLSIEIISGDLQSEAKSVRRVNPWLTYAEPLHRLREFGFCYDKNGISLSLASIGEERLDVQHVRVCVSLVLGPPSSEGEGEGESGKGHYPDPEKEWTAFEASVQDKLEDLGSAGFTYSPIHLKRRAWVRLDRSNSSKIGCSVM